MGVQIYKKNFVWSKLLTETILNGITGYIFGKHNVVKVCCFGILEEEKFVVNFCTTWNEIGSIALTSSVLV